jgi:hypothetical protein
MHTHIVTNTTPTNSGIDTIISALGRTSLLAQIPLLQLAASTPSVKWFLPSEYGTDIAYSPASAIEKPHQHKLAVRRALDALDPAELSWTYVVTGPFAEFYVRFPVEGVRESYDAGGWDVPGRAAVLLNEAGRVSLTTMGE